MTRLPFGFRLEPRSPHNQPFPFCTALRKGSVTVIALLLVAGAADRSLAQSLSGFVYNGQVYTSYQANEYQQTPSGPQGTAAIRATGASHGSVVVTQYVQTYTSNSIAPETVNSPGYDRSKDPLSPTDDAVVAAIQNMHAQGITVFLKPQVDSLDGTFRGEFAPTNPTDWFASYQTFILHYAELASQNGVGGLVIGTELISLSKSAYRSYWLNIIAQLRSSYPNLTLAYGANATYSGDEFTTVSFWDKVDIIGVDGYFPLTNHANPTVAELVAAWTNNKDGFNAVAALKSLQSTYNKPLIFTEIGYVSATGTNETPYASAAAGAAYDPTEQDNCYEAFFEVFSQQSSWMKGVFWWAWNVSPPGSADTGFTPQNKPAADTTLVKWYGSPTTGFTLAPSTSLLTLGLGLQVPATISVTRLGGFNGSVFLAATGLPAGVTASFAPGTAAGTQVMTLNATPAATAGPATVMITGTSGTLMANTGIDLTVQGASAQTITFVDPPTQVVGTPLTLSATASSGLAVTFTSETLAICTVAGDLATFLKAGTCTLDATQAGNASYSAAPQVQQSFSVVAAPSFTIAAAAPAISIAQGASGSDVITINPANGFTGSVALAATGLPAGVTASFASNSATGSSAIMLTPGPAATAGNATVTITGTSGSLTASTTIVLTITPAPIFTIAPSAANLAIIQGSSGTSMIAITAANGFAGNVALSASGLPAGVTAAFGTNPATSSSVVTFTVAPTAATGTAVITIGGTSGTLTASTVITLTISAAPSFTLTPSSSSVSIAPGSIATETIAIAGTGGFVGTVSLSATVTSSPQGAQYPPNLSFGATSPAIVTSAGGTVTLTISTTAPAIAALRHPAHGSGLWEAGGATLAGVLLFGIPGRRRRWPLVFGRAAFLCGIIAMTGCGGSSTSRQPVRSSGTTAGTYIITVTATSAMVTATTPVTVNVK